MIPKKIHYCWVGGAPLPEQDRLCIESWKRHCPDWEIIRWDESNYDFAKVAYMRQAYEAQKWGFVPDYARLDIVGREGGVYLDTDVELLTSLEPLLEYRGFMGWSRDGFVNPGLGFGAEADNPIILALAADYGGVSFVNSDGSLNLVASPHYATEGLLKYGFDDARELQVRDGFALLPWQYLDPLDAATGRMHKSAETLSVHRYAGSWLSEKDRYQKKLRRSLNAVHVPDALAWPISRGIAYVKHEGAFSALRRMVRGR